MLPFFGPEMIQAILDLFCSQPASEKKVSGTDVADNIILTTGASNGMVSAIAGERHFSVDEHICEPTRSETGVDSLKSRLGAINLPTQE